MVKGRWPYYPKPEFKMPRGWKLGHGWYEDSIRDSQIENAKEEELNDSTLSKIETSTA